MYYEDTKHLGNLRAIPKITQHLDLTSMSKMRVRLCTQVCLIIVSNNVIIYKNSLTNTFNQPIILIFKNYCSNLLQTFFFLQIFSSSMAKAMRYYKSRGCLALKGSAETADFTDFWNRLFENFNRTLPWQGLKLENEGFQVQLLFKK